MVSSVPLQEERTSSGTRAWLASFYFLCLAQISLQVKILLRGHDTSC